MKTGVIMVVGLIFINICVCMPINVANHASHDTVPEMKMHSLMSGTDGWNGPLSNDHQCPLGTYPNCRGMSQNTQEAAQDVGRN
ncbi:hypothetical protein CFC21_021103 [Triticum aestivum]|uniref:Uncharacterized protein n=2 Tax=Triticum aestivum TaxID=4565 RepID=A0A3B6C0V5_WHEAT|nr:hypothetical protein CFC21_021103 [Triticum aestivum]